MPKPQRKDPLFMQFTATARILVLNQVGLTALLPYIPHVEVSNSTSVFFPRSYILALAENLNDRQPTPQQLMQFYASQHGQRLLAQTRQAMEAFISRLPHHTMRGIMWLTGFNQKAVERWIREGSFGAQPPHITGDQEPRHITPQELREGLQWRLPTI